MESSQPERAQPGAWLTLFLLFVAYNFSLLDRMILSLLVDPIRRTFHVSDIQVSLLQGFAFLLMYSVAGLPLGLLLDRVHRTRLIAAGVALWSVMTAFCGVAGSFGLLFVARVGVGVGEATLSPGAYSVISSSFPKKRLALALGIFSLGGATGAGVAMIVGGLVYGWLSKHGGLVLPVVGRLEPWQGAFLLVGLPGLVVAALIGLTRDAASPHTGVSEVARWAELRAFYRRRWNVVAPLHLGVALSNMALFGAMSWVTPFFTRVHGWPIAKVGLVAGILNMVAGAVGLLGGGALSDALSASGRSARVMTCVISALVGAVGALGFALAASPWLAAAWMSVFLVGAFVPYNVANAAYQQMLPSHMRGFASAVFLLVVSLFSALGPTLIALMTDRWFGGGAGIRSSLAIFAPLALVLSSGAFLWAREGYRRAVDEGEGAIGASAGSVRKIRHA